MGVDKRYGEENEPGGRIPGGEGASNQFMIGGREDKISIGAAVAWVKDAAWECTVRAGRQVLQ